MKIEELSITIFYRNVVIGIVSLSNNLDRIYLYSLSGDLGSSILEVWYLPAYKT